MKRRKDSPTRRQVIERAKTYLCPPVRLVLVIGCLGGLLVSQNASAGNNYWKGGAGSDWATPANWSTNGIPTAADYAYIGAVGYLTNASVQITQSGEQCKDLYLGYDTGTTGTVTMTGGSLTLNDTANNAVNMIIGNKGNGRFIQTSGIVSNVDHTSFKQLNIGSDTGSSGNYQLDNGTIVGFSHLNVGVKGVGAFVQNAGSLITNLTYLDVGWSGGGQGTYTMNGGDVYVDTGINIANAAAGSFTQNAGRVTTKSGAYLSLGSSSWMGNYTLEGGTLMVGGPLYVGSGAGSHGTLDVGLNATVICTSSSLANALKIGSGGNGLCIMRGGTINSSYVYISPSAATDQGTLQGWGDLNITNNLYMLESTDFSGS